MRHTQQKPKMLWIVATHLGNFPTWATSAAKAISNIRFRLFGGRCGVSTAYWRAIPAA